MDEGTSISPFFPEEKSARRSFPIAAHSSPSSLPSFDAQEGMHGFLAPVLKLHSVPVLSLFSFSQSSAPDLFPPPFFMDIS